MTNDADEPIISTRSIMTPYGEQDENGTDLSLIRHLLSLTPAERLLEGGRENARFLRELGRRRREEQVSKAG